MKYIRLLSRLILGMVFIFSGFVKAVDPLGSAYKFSDYFSAFNLEFLEFSTLPLGIILSAFELVLGIVLILGYRRRIVYWVLMWFMSFFTLLTFILAIFNPVSDCGCFGDALILTNWQTFVKNVVLMVFVLLLYFHRKNEDEQGNVFKEWSIVAGIYVLVSWFSIWNYQHLPLLDFRPYDVGTIIRNEMELPDGAPMDEYETTLIYRNIESGKLSDFNISDYPRDTLLWEFVSSHSRLIKKGYEPPIHDFAIMNVDGTNLADQILSDRGYSLIMISHDLSRADENALMIARGWSQLEILANDYSFFAVTSSSSAEVESRASSMDLGYSFYAADEIMLKTIVRSNPGFVLLKNGIIVGKWGSMDFPAIGEVDPQWPELIGNASAPMDEEAQLLMEAGVYNDFSFDVIDFEQATPGLLFERSAYFMERWVVISFIMGITILLLLSQFVSRIKG